MPKGCLTVAGADKKYAKLPAAMRGQQLGMKYSMVRYLRKLERYSKARNLIFATIPNEAVSLGDADAWWVERRIVARHSVSIDKKESQ